MLANEIKIFFENKEIENEPRFDCKLHNKLNFSKVLTFDKLQNEEEVSKSRVTS